MSSKVMYSQREEDKQEIQKQLGCMNGIFQLFDRRYLLGKRRQKHLPQGQGQGQIEDGNKEFNNASEKPKNQKTATKVVKEKHRVSVESSRNSFSSSCSSLDCSKRVQTEQSSFCPSLVSEPSSPTSRKQPDSSVQPADIRDVVKDSMTRKPRVVPVKTVKKNERKGPAMTHVDSPRPLQQQHLKPVSYDRKDQNLARLREISRGVKEVKEISRFSCDGRESPYKLISIKELPRLSLDSKQSSIRKRENDVDQTHEPGSNKRPPSSVVARLMGLEVLHDFIDREDDEMISLLRSRKSEEFKHNISVSSPQKGIVIGKAVARIPLEPAPWKQEGGQKQPVKNKKAQRVDHGCHSVYGEIEKRLTEVEFNTSGKDLRALKQILEAIQRTKMKLENNKIRTTTIKPANLASDSMVITSLQRVKKVNHTGDRTSRRSTRNTTPIETKATVRTRKSTSPSKAPEYPAAQNYWNSRNSGTVSPRLQRSKNGIHKQSICGQSSNGRLTVSESNTRNSKTRSIIRLQTDEQCGYRSDTRDLTQQGDAGSFPSESDTSVTSQNEIEVTSTDWTGENNSVYQPRGNHKNKYAERLIEYKPMAELAMPTIEQPSPVSVLDAFYSEDAPSPIQKKSYAFKDDEDLRFDEPEWNQVGIDNFVSSTELDQSSSGFNHLKIENIKHLVHQIKLLNSNTEEEATIDHSEFFPHDIIINQDHEYIKQILLASGFLKNLDCATTIVHLHPTNGTLINPELFNILEKTKEITKLTEDGYNKKNASSEKIRRKMIFDTVNNILVEKLARSASSGLWTSKRKAGILNGDKLLKEVCSEINNLQTDTAGGLYDEILNIISSDVNKRSEDWDDNCNEVPALVLDIERLIFKDLISEIVNAKVTSLQDGPERHCRQLFLL
ncbi:protein LONGIFOLIA 2-like [Cynara cardunculus var. scolymus]|uniref:protein LONGIFOLIA 2-like n=1 Tax=Cynara cardunculus var. scolymus TaxID=59895 RepID=UPI000D625C23|nr:protein LONGIFOLIA 2-like [Cynara cardunculus var. scolymus]